MDSFKILGTMLVIAIACVLIGQFALGSTGLLFGLLIGLLLNGIMYFGAGQFYLSGKKAHALDETTRELILPFVHELAMKATIPTPNLMIIPDPQPNICTVGYDPSHATIVLTEGLCALMTIDELKSIIAVQIGTIQRGDIGSASYIALIMCVLTGCATVPRTSKTTTQHIHVGNSISSLIRLVTMPMAVAYLRWTTTPQKKYLQDFLGASLTRDPKTLAQAYRKMQLTIQQNVPLLHNVVAQLHLYALCSTTPEEGKELYQSHPDMSERITKLEGMTV